MDETQRLDYNDDEEETSANRDRPVGNLHMFAGIHGAAQDFPIYRGQNVIGRHASCDITLPAQSVSKKHAILEVRGDCHAICDNSSLNKTRRGKTALAPDVHYALSDGDFLLFADVACRYTIVEKVEAETTEAEESEDDSVLVPATQGALAIEKTPGAAIRRIARGTVLARDSGDEEEEGQTRWHEGGSGSIRDGHKTSGSGTIFPPDTDTIVPESDEENDTSTSELRLPSLSLRCDSDTDTSRRSSFVPSSQSISTPLAPKDQSKHDGRRAVDNEEMVSRKPEDAEMKTSSAVEENQEEQKASTSGGSASQPGVETGSTVERERMLRDEALKEPCSESKPGSSPCLEVDNVASTQSKTIQENPSERKPEVDALMQRALSDTDVKVDNVRLDSAANIQEEDATTSGTDVNTAETSGIQTNQSNEEGNGRSSGSREAVFHMDSDTDEDEAESDLEKSHQVADIEESEKNASVPLTRRNDGDSDSDTDDEGDQNVRKSKSDDDDEAKKTMGEPSKTGGLSIDTDDDDADIPKPRENKADEDSRSNTDEKKGIHVNSDTDIEEEVSAAEMKEAEPQPLKASGKDVFNLDSDTDVEEEVDVSSRRVTHGPQDSSTARTNAPEATGVNSDTDVDEDEQIPGGSNVTLQKVLTDEEPKDKTDVVKEAAALHMDSDTDVDDDELPVAPASEKVGAPEVSADRAEKDTEMTKEADDLHLDSDTDVEEGDAQAEDKMDTSGSQEEAGVEDQKSSVSSVNETAAVSGISAKETKNIPTEIRTEEDETQKSDSESIDLEMMPTQCYLEPEVESDLPDEEEEEATQAYIFSSTWAEPNPFKSPADPIGVLQISSVTMNASEEEIDELAMAETQAFCTVAEPVGPSVQETPEPAEGSEDESIQSTSSEKESGKEVQQLSPKTMSPDATQPVSQYLFSRPSQETGAWMHLKREVPASVWIRGIQQGGDSTDLEGGNDATQAEEQSLNLELEATQLCTVESPSEQKPPAQTEIPTVPAADEDNDTPTVPAADEDNDTPTVPVAGEDNDTPTVPAAGEDKETPTVPAAGEDNTPTVPAAGENKETPTMPAADEDNDTLTMPAADEDNDTPTVPAAGEDKEIPTVPSAGKDKETKTVPPADEDNDTLTVPAAGEDKETPTVPAAGDKESPTVPAAGDKESPAVPAAGEDKETPTVPAEGDKETPAVPAAGEDNETPTVPAAGDKETPTVPAADKDYKEPDVPAERTGQPFSDDTQVTDNDATQAYTLNVPGSDSGTQACIVSDETTGDAAQATSVCTVDTGDDNTQVANPSVPDAEEVVPERSTESKEKLPSRKGLSRSKKKVESAKNLPISSESEEHPGKDSAGPGSLREKPDDQGAGEPQLSEPGIQEVQVERGLRRGGRRIAEPQTKTTAKEEILVATTSRKRTGKTSEDEPSASGINEKRGRRQVSRKSAIKVVDEEYKEEQSSFKAEESKEGSGPEILPINPPQEIESLNAEDDQKGNTAEQTSKESSDQSLENEDILSTEAFTSSSVIESKELMESKDNSADKESESQHINVNKKPGRNKRPVATRLRSEDVDKTEFTDNVEKEKDESIGGHKVRTIEEKDTIKQSSKSPQSQQITREKSQGRKATRKSCVKPSEPESDKDEDTTVSLTDEKKKVEEVCPADPVSGNEKSRRTRRSLKEEVKEESENLQGMDKKGKTTRSATVKDAEPRAKVKEQRNLEDTVASNKIPRRTRNNSKEQTTKPEQVKEENEVVRKSRRTQKNLKEAQKTEDDIETQDTSSSAAQTSRRTRRENREEDSVVKDETVKETTSRRTRRHSKEEELVKLEKDQTKKSRSTRKDSKEEVKTEESVEESVVEEDKEETVGRKTTRKTRKNVKGDEEKSVHEESKQTEDNSKSERSSRTRAKASEENRELQEEGVKKGAEESQKLSPHEEKSKPAVGRGRRVAKKEDIPEVSTPVASRKRGQATKAEVEMKRKKSDEGEEQEELRVVETPKGQRGRPRKLVTETKSTQAGKEISAPDPSPSRSTRQRPSSASSNPPEARTPRRTNRMSTSATSPYVAQSGSAPKILFTGVVDTAGEETIRSLGGDIAESVFDCTHLVTDRVRRTVKFLCALARGIPIVTLDWIDKCKKSGCFLSPTGFLVNDKEQEKNFNFTLSGSLQKAKRHPLLEGYEIHVTANVKPEPDQMKDIIRCSGATFLPKMPRSFKGKYVVVSCPEDAARCKSVPASVPITSTEFILSGILRQEVNPTAYLLNPAVQDTGPTPAKRRR